MTRTVVLPVNGQSNPMFTLIDPNGDDLHKHLIELNRAHADQEVRKNTGEVLVSELERIRDNIEETQGVNRRDMEEVEATSGTSLESFPITGFTERRSGTGLTIALEEIDIRRASIIAGAIVGGLALLYKIIKWFTGRNSASGGGGGGGGSSRGFGGKSDEEFKKEIEDLEEVINEKEAIDARHNIEGKLDAEGKKKLEDDIDHYLASRTVFIENLMSGNPSYSKAFAQFIPAFIDRFEKEQEILEKTIGQLKEIAELDPSELDDKVVARIQAISGAIEDPQFTPQKWEPYQIFMKACDVSSGGARTLRECTTTLMDKFRKEQGQRSKLRPQELKANGFKKSNDDIRMAVQCLDDMEDAGGEGNNSMFYIPESELESGINALDKCAEQIKSIGEAFSKRHEGNYSAAAIKCLLSMQNVVNQLTARATMMNAPIMINEMFGKETRRFLNDVKKFTKQYLAIAK